MLFEGAREQSDDPIDTDIILSRWNSYSNDPNFDVSAFFATHGVESDDAVSSTFLNDQCVSREAPRCSEAARTVRSRIFCCRLPSVEPLHQYLALVLYVYRRGHIGSSCIEGYDTVLVLLSMRV